jgi:hypothetical protein
MIEFVRTFIQRGRVAIKMDLLEEEQILTFTKKYKRG